MAYSSRRDSVSFCKPDFQICVVGSEMKNNGSLMNAIKTFDFPIVYSATGQEFLKQGAEYTTVFILDDFEGDIYTNLHKSGQRIFGPTAILEFSTKKLPLPNNMRPLYNSSMKSLIVCFTGFRLKEELTVMVALIHHMGGSIRKDFSISKTTHLISNTNAGEKYRYAASSSIPIMSAQWVFKCWEQRNVADFCATNEEMMKYKLPPFVSCNMALIGYQNEEAQHMTDVSLENGGKVVSHEDSSCTHIVIADGFTFNTSSINHQLHIVKNEWFWACIQMEAKANEAIYVFENPCAAPSTSLIWPTKGNKRKRLDNVAHQLAMESLHEADLFSLNPDLGRKHIDKVKLSISGSFLDATMSPDKSRDLTADSNVFDGSVLKSPAVDLRTLSARQQVCLELFQTESNYVTILNTIMTVFKEPLEQPEQVGGPLLAPAEIKIIFGNLPPIHDVHQKFRAELAHIMQHWKEDHSIGDLVLNHAPEFMKAYPPFVNFFEESKLVLNTSDLTKPRFHAFLKRCQSKPECGRQNLQELLIRPVQRLPSMILLLSDILKHTPKNSQDCQSLEKAIQAVKEVLMHINEDKRKTEGQMAMFDIVNDIENCPPILLSSHRNYVTKADMQEITDLLNKRSSLVTLFLFTDVLEICKKRYKSSTLKSPGVVSLTSGTMKIQSKSYKHLELIPLAQIKRIVDITETEECKNSFAIVVRSNRELKELLYAFVLIDDICKATFLRTLSRQVANSLCKADAENLLTTLEPQQLSLQTSEPNGNALTKALSKTRVKIGRALSMRRTPTKRSLNRAVSTILSPLMNMASPNNNMNTLRLSSVTNLAEYESNPSSLTASPVGGKKMKSSSLGISAAKYL